MLDEVEASVDLGKRNLAKRPEASNDRLNRSIRVIGGSQAYMGNLNNFCTNCTNLTTFLDLCLVNLALISLNYLSIKIGFLVENTHQWGNADEMSCKCVDCGFLAIKVRIADAVIRSDSSDHYNMRRSDKILNSL